MRPYYSSGSTLFFQSLLIITVAILSGCASNSFVYQGRITKIKSVSIVGGPAFRYKVETDIEEILQGSYTKKECTLHMIDPYKSGLKEGESYLFHVKREGLHYTPDEFQLKRKLYQ